MIKVVPEFKTEKHIIIYGGSKKDLPLLKITDSGYSNENKLAIHIAQVAVDLDHQHFDWGAGRTFDPAELIEAIEMWVDACD